MFSSFTLTLLGPVFCLLPVEPVCKLVAIAVLLITQHLHVLELTLQLSIILLILVQHRVVDEDVFAVDKRDTSRFLAEVVDSSRLAIAWVIITFTLVMVRGVSGMGLSLVFVLVGSSRVASVVLSLTGCALIAILTCSTTLILDSKLARHCAGHMRRIVILKGLFELQLDFLIVRNQLFLVSHDHSKSLLLIEVLDFVGSSLACLLVDPLLFACLDPLGEELLGFCVSLDEDVVFVKF